MSLVIAGGGLRATGVCSVAGEEEKHNAHLPRARDGECQDCHYCATLNKSLNAKFLDTMVNGQYLANSRGRTGRRVTTPTRVPDVGLIVMRQLSLWLGLFGILGFGTLNLTAQPPSGTVTKGSVYGSWQEYWNSPPSGQSNPTAWAVSCPGASSPCGYSNFLSTDGYSSVGPAGGSASDGWHNYNPTVTYTGSCTGSPYPNCNAQNYLNSLVICTTNCSGTQKLSFSVNGYANLNSGPFGSPVDLFRNPVSDNGYFLSTPGPAGFEISAPSGYYFNSFSFYWGSVDPWNALTFTGSDGTTTSIYGTDLGFTFSDPNHTSSAPNIDSATIGFVPNLSTDPNWSSVKFTACSDPAGSLGGTCFHAFEIDNLQFTLTTSAAGAFVPGGLFAPTPTPEPSSMLLLGTGIAGLAILLRRKFPR